MLTTDFLVIGGGVLGIAAAREARRRHPASRVVLLEKEADVAKHASGRNSGVLHTGIYYPPDSLKAQFSCEGNRRLTDYCVDRNLPIRRCGKILVAGTDEEQAGLDELLRRGRANGVVVEEIDEVEARELDPAVRVHGRALFTPHTASIDPVAVVRSLADEAREAGVEIRTNETFLDNSKDEIVTSRERWSVGYAINAGGAFADRIAGRFGFADGYRIMPFMGRYLRLKPQVRLNVRRHIYPMPDLRYPFLGVHCTISAYGEVWIGPTATPVLGREQYRLREVGFNSLCTVLALARLLAVPHNRGLRRLALRELTRSRQRMLMEASRLVRNLPGAKEWEQGRPGIRAQLVDTCRWKLENDFVYQADDRSFHVLNGVSPGFTCALPLAEHMLDIIEHRTT